MATADAFLQAHRVHVSTGRPLPLGSDARSLADVVLTLPLPEGPAIPGLPGDQDGFLPVDARMTVLGAESVHAIGDVTSGIIKQGGLAAQQADVAAMDLADGAGAGAAPSVYAPVLRGRLTVPGRRDGLYLRRALDASDAGVASTTPLWPVPGVVCARRLSGSGSPACRASWRPAAPTMSPGPVPPASDRGVSPPAGRHWWRLRTVRPADLEAVEALLAGFDERDRYRRWFTAGVDLHRAALWAAHPETQSGVGLVAESGGRLIGHGALAPIDAHRAEVAFEVAADWRHHGIAGRLLAELERAAADRGLTALEAEVLPGNRDMLQVFREHGPCTLTSTEGVVHVVMPVRPLGRSTPAGRLRASRTAAAP